MLTQDQWDESIPIVIGVIVQAILRV